MESTECLIIIDLLSLHLVKPLRKAQKAIVVDSDIESDNDVDDFDLPPLADLIPISVSKTPLFLQASPSPPAAASASPDLNTTVSTPESAYGPSVWSPIPSSPTLATSGHPQLSDYGGASSASTSTRPRYRLADDQHNTWFNSSMPGAFLPLPQLRKTNSEEPDPWADDYKVIDSDDIIPK